MEYKKWSLEKKLEIGSFSEETGVVDACRKHSVRTGTFYSWKKKHESPGEAGLKGTYNTKSKEHKQAEEENRILRKLPSNRDIELEIQRELFKKTVWDVRSKKDLVNAIYTKYKISKTAIINMVGMVHSSYYRTPSFGKKGNKPSALTYHKSKGWVHQDAVLASVKAILSHEFIDCGYRLMNSYLQKDGYLINHKKLYRIMSEQGLLKLENRINRSGSGRKFVKFRKVNTARPFECLEMDIKMVWIPSVGKNGYLLSIIDVHTRVILKDYFSFSIKQDTVIAFLSDLFLGLQYPGNVVIRSDNGSQFIANSVREYLGLIGVQQEFTHVATPEENAHIEAYHGILKKEVFQRVDYRTFGEIEQILKRYVIFYTNTMLHGLLGRITPMEKWNQDKHLILMKNLTA